MKKRVRYSAILASAVMLCSQAMPAQASSLTPAEKTDLHYFGTVSGAAFQDMEMLEDAGMLGYDLIYTHHIDCEEGYSDPACYTWDDAMYGVNRRMSTVRFVLRSDAAEEAQQAEQIAKRHFPDGILYQTAAAGTYDLTEKDETKRTAEASAALMTELAAAGLISEFYTWGQTADYQEIVHGYLTAYKPADQDWEAVAAWVQAEHPECSFTCIPADETETDLAKKVRSDYWNGNPADCIYAVIPPAGTTFSAHFALAAELWETFGLHANAYTTPYEKQTKPLTGKNALAIAGDVNLDCDIDVADAVLTARFCAEDAEAVITDQGQSNADCNGDGGITQDDVVQILKKIAKLD